MMKSAKSIKLDEEDSARLERIMKETGRSASNLFRHLLRLAEVSPDVRLPSKDEVQP
jgi:predicted DNA-binding protein